MRFDYKIIQAISSNEAIVITSITNLHLFQRWEYNRPPDMEKVNSIKQSIHDNTFVHGIIYIAEMNDRLVCYDGNHRREALLNFKSGNIVINFLRNATDKIIEKRFRNLNLSTPVSDLYLDDPNTTNDIKISIQDCVKKLSTNYKQFNSFSSRCKRPNFNRDTLTDYLYQICKNHSLLLKSDEIYNILIKINEKYSSLNFKCNDKIKKKITEHKFFLFINGLSFEKDFLEIMKK